MEIKEADSKDAPKIVDLWLEFMKEHDDIVLNKNPKLKKFTIKDKEMKRVYKKFLGANIRSKSGTAFIAKENNAIAGYTLVLLKDEIPIFKNKKIGYISDLYVKKGFRKQGISSKLKDKAVQWLTKKDVKFISLSVYSANNAAHSIYKKWGFIDYKIEMRK